MSGIRRIRILFTIPYSGTEHATYTYREYSVAYSMTQPDAFHLHGNFRHLRKFNANSLARLLERTAREISRLGEVTYRYVPSVRLFPCTRVVLQLRE